MIAEDGAYNFYFYTFSSSPIPPGYYPECDISPEFNEEEASYYQPLIGITRWIDEMDRIYIACEVSMII